jgi:hypothetical protein
VSDMKVLFLLAVLMVLPSVSASDLRRETGMEVNLAQRTIPRKPAKVGTMTYVGPIPTSPIYSSIKYYEAGCQCCHACCLLPAACRPNRQATWAYLPACSVFFTDLIGFNRTKPSGGRNIR